MAKEVYKIPYTIDNVKFRALVSLKIGSFGLKKQVYIYQVIGWLFVFMITAAFLFMSPIKYAKIWSVPIGLATFWLGVMSLKTQPNGLPGYAWIRPTLNYLVAKGDRRFVKIPSATNGIELSKNKKNKISINFSSKLKKIRSLTEFDAISGGQIFGYQNGDVGILYRVSGFTSLVILDQELDLVIDATNRWYSSLDQNTSITLVTDYSNQRVNQQQAHLLRLQKFWNDKGSIPKPIAKLLKREYDELRSVHKRYKSSQQYLILRANSIDVLDKEVQQLNVAVQQNVLKSIEPVDTDNALPILRNVMYGDI